MGIAKQNLGTRVHLCGNHGTLGMCLVASVIAVACLTAELSAFQEIVRIQGLVRHHTAQCVSSPEYGCRATLDFNGFQGRQVDKIPVTGIVRFHDAGTIDDDLDAVAADPANGEPAKASERSGSRCLSVDTNAGLVTDQFLDIVDVVFLHPFAGNDADNGGDIKHFFFLPGCCDSDGSHFLRGIVLFLLAGNDSMCFFGLVFFLLCLGKGRKTEGGRGKADAE